MAARCRTSRQRRVPPRVHAASSRILAAAAAVLCCSWRVGAAYDTSTLDDTDLNVLHKPLPYGGVQCCGTAYPALDPVPRVSVILQYYKMAPNIDPLASWKDCPGVEFIVNVDSTDALDTKWLNTSADHVVFSRNIHETRAYNRLAGVSRAPITLFVQDDDAPPSDCRYVDHVEKMFGHDPKLAVVGFNVGTNTPWNHVWQSPDGPVYHIRSHDAKHKWGLGNIAAEYAACVDIGPFAVRRREFLAMGGFDESFSYPGKGAVGLDFDVATRAWLSGHTVAKYDPHRSGVGHVQGLTYPSGKDGLRAKAAYYDKDSTELAARGRAFAQYESYYDRISALVLRKNKGLKLWGAEETEMSRKEAGEEASRSSLAQEALRSPLEVEAGKVASSGTSSPPSRATG